MEHPSGCGLGTDDPWVQPLRAGKKMQQVSPGDSVVLQGQPGCCHQSACLWDCFGDQVRMVWRLVVCMKTEFKKKEHIMAGD